MSKARDLADLAKNANDRLDDVATSDGALSNRNVIVNGDMRISQRGSSFTVTNAYGLDRWYCRENTDGALTFSQDSESPDGFSKSLKVNVDTADTSIGYNRSAYLTQRLEGYTIERFAFGGSGAKKITLSFYIRCSVTGKFGGAIVNGFNNNRSYAFTYDIDTANTWERKTIVFEGDTVGTWNVDNTQEMAIFWSLGGGSTVKKAEGSWDATANVQSATEADTELLETSSATWYITGVQLEVGDTATPFEHRSYSDELARCQRFFQWNPCGPVSFSGGSNQAAGGVALPVALRSTPTITVVTGTDAIDEFYVQRRDLTNTLTIYDDSPSNVPKTSYSLFGSCEAGATANITGCFMAGHWTLDAEL